MTVDIDKLKALLAVLSEENVSEFEHEAEGVRVRIVRGGVGPAMYSMMVPPPSVAAPAVAAIDTAPPADMVDVTSPFVGTFYKSPSPEGPSFADVGTVVRPGQTLCIIEAMKLMNEIESEMSGTVVEVFAQNGKAVEFGQKLFRIKKA